MSSSIRSLNVNHFGGAVTVHFPTHSLYSPISEDTATPQWVRLVLELGEFTGNHAFFELDSDHITSDEGDLEAEGFRQIWHLPALTRDGANEFLATIASELVAITRSWTSEDFGNVALGPIGERAYNNVTNVMNRFARDHSLDVAFLADRAEEEDVDAAVDYALTFGFTTPEGIEHAIREWFSIPNQIVLADTFALVGPVLRNKLERQQNDALPLA